MTRSELIARIAKQFPHLVQKDAQVSVDLILNTLCKSMTEGRRTEIRGFGSFSLHYRPPKAARNPKTGEALAVPGKHVPYFKPGQPLLEHVQRGETGQGAARRHRAVGQTAQNQAAA